MNDQEKSKNCLKKSWNDFVKGVSDVSKLFHKSEPKTNFLCSDVDYTGVSSMVADRIFSTLFLSKNRFLQEEENEEFKFIEKPGFSAT